MPALLLPFLIRSAVVEGIATATEVSTIGIAYSLVAGLLIYRGGLKWKAFRRCWCRRRRLSGAILFIVGAASAMAWALTQSGFSHDLAAMMAAVPGGAVGFMLISIVAFIVLGSVLEGIPAIVLFGPLLFPVARQLGIHEVHYAMVVILAMGLGLFAPPFGLCYYAACIIGDVSRRKRDSAHLDLSGRPSGRPYRDCPGTLDLDWISVERCGCPDLRVC